MSEATRAMFEATRVSPSPVPRRSKPKVMLITDSQKERESRDQRAFAARVREWEEREHERAFAGGRRPRGTHGKGARGVASHAARK